MSRQRSPMLAVLGFPVRMVRSLPRTVLALLVIGGLLFSIAVLTHSGLNRATSELLSAAGLSTVAERSAAAAAQEREADRIAAESATQEATEQAARAARAEAEAVALAAAQAVAAHTQAQHDLALLTARQVRDRLVQQVDRNIDAAFAEAIPVTGIAVIAAGLARDVKDSCDTARDLAGLEAALGTGGDPAEAHRLAIDAYSCADILPGPDEVPTRDEIWEQVVQAPEMVWEKARNSFPDLSEVDWRSNVAQSADYLRAQADKLEPAARGLLSDWFGRKERQSEPEAHE
ncbi:hypothetical protein [Ruegeria marina]|uniref:Uncharacterized protein n=1 Tax=Ruegeria marina TaxID=639004 RepID=A0A1G7BJF1_9RHOB|nr:hypothetical protein [Ruegeria marina]SDE26820.1 hypothetical protein SAMN04488239_116105 [Ruegeria marina]